MKNKRKLLIAIINLFLINLYPYKEADLEKIKNNETNLTNLDLSEANLEGIDLSFKNISGSNFNKANLRRSNLRQVIAQNTNFSDANLEKSNLFCAYIDGANFKNTNLSESVLVGLDINFLKNFPFITLEKNFIKYQISSTEIKLEFFLNYNDKEIIIIHRKPNLPMQNALLRFIDIMHHKINPNLYLSTKAFINNFPRFFEQTLNNKINFRNEFMALEKPVIKNEQCSICLCDFEDCEKIALTTCGHSFCEECINQSMLQKLSCPICRYEPIIGYKTITYLKN